YSEDYKYNRNAATANEEREQLSWVHGVCQTSLFLKKNSKEKSIYLQEKNCETLSEIVNTHYDTYTVRSASQN
ncbi:unnamed protein product, partial [Callosobruchus maculatus]